SVLHAAHVRERLQFDNDRFEANEVRLVERSQARALVQDLQFDLRLKRYAARRQFKSHGFLINRFEEAAPELRVHLHRRADNRISSRIAFWAWHFHGAFSLRRSTDYADYTD